MSDKDKLLDHEEFQELQMPGEPVSFATIDPDNNSTDYKFTVEPELDHGNDLLISEEVDLEEKTQPLKTAFWSFEFYQQFFDVDDRMVLNRLLYSFLPNKNTNYMDHLKPLPDFYGPFWVCVTLIFSTAISGNLADFFQSLGSDTDWTYDFKKVTIAATVVFSYVTVIPALLSGYLWWRKSNTSQTLVDSLSLYGYSLTIFIPISILLCVNHEWIRWLLVLVLIGTSGVVLTVTIWRILSEEPKQIALIITAVLAALHVALILVFKMYFFSISESSSTPT